MPETSRVAQRHGQEAEALKYIRGARALLVEDNEINQQVELEILESARSLVHDLKGIAGNLSAVDLLAAVTDLWSLLRAQDPDKDIARDALDQKILDLHNHLRRALKALHVLAPSPEQISGEVPSEKTIVLPVELTKAELDSIRDAVEMGDVAKLISIAKNIASHSDDFIQFSESIIRWAESFDFDRILKLINNSKGEA